MLIYLDTESEQESEDDSEDISEEETEDEVKPKKRKPNHPVPFHSETIDEYMKR